MTRQRLDDETREELEAHLQLLVEKYVRSGMTPDQARAAARRQFGNVTWHREEIHLMHRNRWIDGLGFSWLDVQLGLRMIVRYKGLTIAGGLALAIAIGVGAAWYNVLRDQTHPTVPLPEGNRLVEIDLRNVATGAGEWRVLHDFLSWRKDARTIEEVGAYQTLERNLVAGDARTESVNVAAITASAFRLTRVPPLHGRPLLDLDEQAGAQPVAVIGYGVWQQQFGGRIEAIGQTTRLGRTMVTIVGVMPEGFAFPVNHELWIPLQLEPSGYAPLAGAGVRVFGRLAPGADLSAAKVEIAALTAREAAVSPQTHAHLRSRVFRYGADDFADDTWLDFAMTHAPVLLLLLVACANVGTLVYARTATREAEISLRHALGASRARIVGQLFVEALVLAALAAAVGLIGADAILRWTFNAFSEDIPFWLQPGLKVGTIAYASVLTVLAAAILGALPAIKATGSRASAHLRNLGAGGATLRFGKVWSAAMIGQVALTAICIPPAMGIAEEALRDRVIRSRFPAGDYLAVGIDIDRESMPTHPGQSAASAFALRVDQLYRELERHVAREPGVLAVAFGDRLPGMAPAVRRFEVEAVANGGPIRVGTVWTAAVGPGYFSAFDRSLLSGRDFHDGDRVPEAGTVLVNQAFARRYGASPLGRRLRYASPDPAKPTPWLEIVGVVHDIGLTPTDFGEAPYLFHPASPGTTSPLVMGVRTAGDPSTLAPRVRAIAAALDPGMRLNMLQPLDEVIWSEDAPMLAASGGIAAVSALAMFLSAAGIFSLMSVTVARRTREIGLRVALGAGRGRVLTALFSRALILVGGGVAVGNSVLLLFVILNPGRTVAGMVDEVLTTSVVMLAVGFVGCLGPARRALRISPAEALKEA